MQSMGVIVLTMGNRANYGGNRAKIVFGTPNHSNSRGYYDDVVSFAHLNFTKGRFCDIICRGICTSERKNNQMEKENVKRVRLLRIWEILKQESDEDHPMSSLVLLAKLKEGGIECDRRTLYSDIKVLNDFG